MQPRDLLTLPDTHRVFYVITGKVIYVDLVIVLFFRLLWLLDSQEIGAALRKFGGRRPLGNMRAEGPPRKFGPRRAPKK